MSLALDHIAARDLARELLERIPTIVRGQLTRSMRRRHRPVAVPQVRAADDRATFATFTRGDAPSLALLNGSSTANRTVHDRGIGFPHLAMARASRDFRDHGGLLTPESLADCRRLNPTVAVRDLMCRYYTMLLVKS